MRYFILGSRGFIAKGIINYFKKKKIKLTKYKTISELIPAQLKKMML